MGVVGVNFNPAESVGLRMLNRHRQAMGVSMERLATGSRINRASDDPAGSIAAAGLKGERKVILKQLAQIKMSTARNNVMDENLSITAEQLIEIQGHIVAAANDGGLTKAEREAHQIEVNSLVDTLVVLGATANFNGELLLNNVIGTSASVTLDGEVSEPVSLNALRTGGTLNLINGDMEKAQKFVAAILEQSSLNRARVGADQRALDSEERELSNRDINLAAALSEIQDTDYAEETAELVRTQILTETATAAVQTARDLQAETVLALIRGDMVEEVRAEKEADKAAAAA